jgi:NADH dehydrogenase (ubiquinone) 1 alpha/beta subcomplex 1
LLLREIYHLQVVTSSCSVQTGQLTIHPAPFSFLSAFFVALSTIHSSCRPILFDPAILPNYLPHNKKPVTMFRTALLRTAPRAASMVAVRPAAARTFIAVAARPVRVMAPRAASYQAVRMYSAGGGLNKEEVEGRIMSLLSGFDKVNDPANIKPTAHFANDLGLDSLDTVEVVMAIEEEFSIEIPDKDADGIHSIEQAVTYILNQPDAN